MVEYPEDLISDGFVGRHLKNDFWLATKVEEN
jgi:hypothetical protein